MENERQLRDELSIELQELAFDEAPQFGDGDIDSMGVERTFKLHDSYDADIERSVSDETILNMGFRALRVCMYGHDEYRYQVYSCAWRDVNPEDLDLGEVDWHILSELYELDDDDYESEDEHVDVDTLKDTLADEDAACKQFVQADYTFDTGDGELRFSDKRGYTIDGEYFGMSETHPVEYTRIFQPEVDKLDENSTGDAIVTHLLFDEVIGDLETEYNENGDIMPYADKVKELQFLVNCLRERRIKL